MNEEPHAGRIRIGMTKQKGRGVFAVVPMAQGEVVEIAPVIVILGELYHHIGATVLENYVFNFGPEGVHSAVVLGYGMLYNHSYSPNAQYFKHWEEQVVRFVAVRDIAAGEEITVNYNNGIPTDQSPVWFDVTD